MIQAVIVMNTEGKPRLSKFYNYMPVEKQQELIQSVYAVLCSRAENVSNFIKADSIFGPLSTDNAKNREDCLLVREGGIPPLVALSQSRTARAKRKSLGKYPKF